MATGSARTHQAVADASGGGISTATAKWFTNNPYAVAQTDTPQMAAPGAGQSLYITGIFLSTDTGMNIQIVENTGGGPSTQILGPYHFAANGGAVITPIIPAIQVTENTDVGMTSSAPGNHTITLVGYTGPA